MYGNVSMSGTFHYDGNAGIFVNSQDPKALRVFTDDDDKEGQGAARVIRPVKLPGHAIQIASGGEFSVALLNNRTLHTWGFQTGGELARETPDGEIRDITTGKFNTATIINKFFRPSPACFLKMPLKVHSVGCGVSHLLVVAYDEQRYNRTAVFAAGLNASGQLGLGYCSEKEEKLTRIPSLDGKNITQVDGGSFHSICCGTLDEGHSYIYTFGLGNSGQLGITQFLQKYQENGVDKFYKSTPQWVFLLNPNNNNTQQMIPEKVTKVYAKADQSFALSSENHLYGWGFGEELQLGNGLAKYESFPRLVKDKKGLPLKVTECYPGDQHTVVTALVEKSSRSR